MGTQSEARTLVAVVNPGDKERGLRIHERRTHLGINLAGLARRAGVDRGTLKRIEEGRDGARAATFGAIERALTELEESMDIDPEDSKQVVRFVVRGVYGAESLVVEGPVENIAELEASVDRIMRRLGGKAGDDPEADA